MKELRINFPDYTAEQQEADAKKNIKELYISRVEGAWHGFIPRKKCSITITADKGVELAEFVQVLKEEYPGYKMRCVHNYGIEQKMRDDFAKLAAMKRFNEGR